MNKMFKKIFAVVAACATVATMSVSALAAEEAAHEAGSVSVTGYAAVEGATQYTVMVFEDSFTGTEVEKIFYINQGADFEALLTGMLVKGGELAEGDYTVRIGNDAGEAVDVDLKVVAVDDDTVVTVIWGDVNLDGFVDSGDISAIAQRSIGGQTSFTETVSGVTFTIDETNGVLWGDVNLDGFVDSGDISAIAQRSIGGQTTFGDYTIDQTVTITIPSAE